VFLPPLLFRVDLLTQICTLASGREWDEVYRKEIVSMSGKDI
jgi:hypothetical protein